jgi:hypothetical protein
MEKYITDNLYLASALLSLGYKNYSLKQEGRKVFFIFDYPKDKILKNEDEYWREEMLVSPKKLFMAYKELKNRISSLGLYVYERSKSKYPTKD